MKTIVIGSAMLIFPTGFMLYLIADKIGTYKTIGVFVITVAWICIAVDLLYEGAKKLGIEKKKKCTVLNVKQKVKQR